MDIYIYRLHIGSDSDLAVASYYRDAGGNLYVKTPSVYQETRSQIS